MDLTTILLVGASGDERFSDDLQSRLEESGFKVLRDVDDASVTKASVAVVVLSGNDNPFLADDLTKIQAAYKPVLTVALDDVDIPASFASYRVPKSGNSGLRLDAAAT